MAVMYSTMLFLVNFEQPQSNIYLAGEAANARLQLRQLLQVLR
jgi:hypothetical protein